MNLLMFNYEYPPLGGGGGVIHQQIAEELARRHRVTVVTSAFADLPRAERVRGVDVRRVPVWGRRSAAAASLASMLSYFPTSLRAGRELIAELQPDLINTHFAIPTGPSATLLARRHRLPHVLSIHGGDIFDPSKRLSPHRVAGLRRVVRWVLEQADRVVAPSTNIADYARRLHGCEREIAVIPHGLRYAAVPPAARGALGLRAGERVLVTVGRLVARKANDRLLHVLAQLPDPQTRLVIVGDGPERGPLEQLARELNVAERVVFTGFVDDVRKYQLLAAADVFVSATAHEGFGLMYLEAMHCGLPVVTFDHGGQSDFLADGATGFLVPLATPERFPARVAQLLADAELRRRIGERNRTLAERYSVERCAADYERVFRDLLAEKHPAGTRAAERNGGEFARTS